MPTYLVKLQETRIYEIEAASEQAARSIFDEIDIEVPLGALRSATRTGLSVERLDIAVPDTRANDNVPDPSSEPTLPTPRAY